MSDYRRIRTGRGQANLGHGNQNIGRDDNRRYVHNQGGMYAEGNLHYRDGDYYDVQHGPTDPFDDIAGGRGVGRGIAAIGMLIALAGFGGWMYVIFSGFASDGEWFDPMAIPTPVLGYPLMVVGFAAVVVGGAISAIGGSMAKAARRRHERAMYYRRRRGL